MPEPTEPAIASLPDATALRGGTFADENPDEGTADARTTFPPIDPATLRLIVDECGRLQLLREGFDNQQVVARRAFPWSQPGQFISLRNKDGNELILLDSLDLVPAEARDQIRHALASGTFIPRISRIREVNLEHGYQLWDISTEAGDLQIRVQEREDIRFLSDTRFSVKDANGNLYEIADASKLDEQSRKELARVV